MRFSAWGGCWVARMGKLGLARRRVGPRGMAWRRGGLVSRLSCSALSCSALSCSGLSCSGLSCSGGVGAVTSCCAELELGLERRVARGAAWRRLGLFPGLPGSGVGAVVG